MTADQRDLALSLGGGGARSAYQVGVLRALARHFPDFEPPILNGVSAGAINIAHLAHSPAPFAERTEELVRLWTSLEVNQVFETRAVSLLWRMFRVGTRLTIGLPRSLPPRPGMVDTEPLRQTLCSALGSPDGVLRGVTRHIESGRQRAVALTATRYATGQTVTFFEGGEIEGWERPQRRAVRTPLTVEHVMASAALPLLFPAVPLDGIWHGDGGIRLVAPLAPALHLGAGKMLSISTRYQRPREEADVVQFSGAPSPAQVVGVLFNAIFLDQLEQDAAQLWRTNALLEKLAPEDRLGLRPVDLLVIRPSIDLGAVANDFEPRLPPTFRFLMRRLGTRKSRTQDLLSTVLFQSDYVSRLIEIGEADGEANVERVAALLEA